jgi:hypothetical protein
MKKPDEIDAFQKLELQVHSCRREIAELSRKKPNDAINKFKLGHLNSLLEKANVVLGTDVPLEGFTVFEVDQVPTNSDAVFVLAQYTDALHRFRSQNMVQDKGVTIWKLSGSKERIQAPRLSEHKYRE